MTTDGRHPGAARERALDLAVPALGLAFAAVLLLSSGHLVGPAGWYARVLAAVLGVVALVGLVAEIIRFRRSLVAPSTTVAVEDAEPDSDAPARGGLLRVGILVASVIAMVLLANPLGFWLAMIIPVVTALVLLGVRSWWKVLIATVLTVAGGYVLFTLLLQVRVPEGILGLL